MSARDTQDNPPAVIQSRIDGSRTSRTSPASSLPTLVLPPAMPSTLYPRSEVSNSRTSEPSCRPYSASGGHSARDILPKNTAISALLAKGPGRLCRTYRGEGGIRSVRGYPHNGFRVRDASSHLDTLGGV